MSVREFNGRRYDTAHTVTRTYEFAAAHRLVKHPGKCAHLHGHTFTAAVTLLGEVDPATGMIIDLAQIDTQVKLWVDTYWDHNAILNPHDPLAWFLGNMPEFAKKPFLMPPDKPEPTVENLGLVLMSKCVGFFANRLPAVAVKAVVVAETPRGFATLTCL